MQTGDASVPMDWIVGICMMICSNCGKENQGNASFCNQCGARFQQPQNHYPLYPYQAARPQELSDDPTIRALLPVGRTGLSIAAGWIGFFSLIIWPLGFIAVIFSIVALNELNKRPDMLGKGRALFGLMAGLVGIGLFILVIVTIFTDNL